MQTIKVHDKKIALVLNKAEAKAILYRLQNGNGTKRSKSDRQAEVKLLVAMGEI